MSHLNDVRPVVKEGYVQISITVGEEINFFCGLRFLCMMSQVSRCGALEWSSFIIIGKYFQSTT